MLKEYPNTYVDTSFMPHEHLRVLLKFARELGFTDRILFGTDTPIPERHLKSSLPRHLRARIATSKQIAGKDWKKISWENANRLLRGMVRQAHQPTPPK
jgi:predicted TIM-barrel fold metal-dependent hydrolase